MATRMVSWSKSNIGGGKKSIHGFKFSTTLCTWDSETELRAARAMLWSECKPVDVLWEKLYVTSAEMLFVVVLMERKPMRGHCQLKMFGGEGGGCFFAVLLNAVPDRQLSFTRNIR